MFIKLNPMVNFNQFIGGNVVEKSYIEKLDVMTLPKFLIDP